MHCLELLYFSLLLLTAHVKHDMYLSHVNGLICVRRARSSGERVVSSNLIVNFAITCRKDASRWPMSCIRVCSIFRMHASAAFCFQVFMGTHPLIVPTPPTQSRMCGVFVLSPTGRR